MCINFTITIFSITMENDKPSIREAKDALQVLDSLGGDITGNYAQDLKRANKLNITFSEKLYMEAYQISEQP